MTSPQAGRNGTGMNGRIRTCRISVNRNDELGLTQRCLVTVGVSSGPQVRTAHPPNPPKAMPGSPPAELLPSKCVPSTCDSPGDKVRAMNKPGVALVSWVMFS